MKNSLQHLYLIGGFLALSACHPSPSPATRIIVSTDLRATPMHALVITSPQQKISGQIPNLAIQKLITGQQDKHLLVQAQLSNLSGARQLIDYRVRWLDANGIHVDHYATWQIFTIEAKQTAVLKVIAPSRQARDFVLELKRHD